MTQPSVLTPYTGAVIVLMCVWSGCGQPVASVEPDSTATSRYSYTEHVAPILALRCVGCHSEGGVAPFPLDTYEDARRWSSLARSSVVALRMPPFPPAHDDTCAPLDDVRRMETSEREVLVEWFDGGQPKGPPQDARRDDSARQDDTFGEPSLRVSASVGYQAPAEIVEEYRCFLVNEPVDGSQWVHRLSIETAQWERFHHAQIYLLPPERLPEAEALDGVDGRPGWPCLFNPAMDDLTLGGRFVTGLEPRSTPPGTGVWVDDGSYFVVDTHIHHYGPSPLDFDIVGWSPTVVRGEEPNTVIDVLLEDRDFLIPAETDDASAVIEGRVVTTQRNRSPALWTDGRMPEGFIWDIDLHMHDRGTRGSIELVRSDGTSECLLDIPRWDVQWQGGYRLSTPVRVQPGDLIVATCHWSNLREDQPVINGVQNIPQDVLRGADVHSEMCAVRLTMTRP